jgi:hypothetical protein
MKNLKQTQKLRVMVDGVGIYATKRQFLDGLFATSAHQQAFQVALERLESGSGTGIALDVAVYDGQLKTRKDVWIQLDRIDKIG